MDNISDKQIDSLCRPAVEGKNAPKISRTVKKAKKSLRKQTNTVKKTKRSLRKQTNASPVLDLGKTQYLFF